MIEKKALDNQSIKCFIKRVLLFIIWQLIILVRLFLTLNTTGLYMKSSRFLSATFLLEIKIVEKNQTFNLTLNYYFLYTLLATVFCKT